MADEALLMTMQLAMVGSDGLIVGSDRKVAYRTREGVTAPYDYQVTSQDKFVRNSDDSLICFFAGESAAMSIADAVLTRGDSGLPFYAWREDLKKTAETTRPQTTGEEVTVIRHAASSTDIALINNTENGVAVSPISQFRCMGVNVKSRFLTQLFWKETSVDSLVRLGLAVLGYAARERPETVGCGFDLMVIRNGGVKWECYTEDDERVRTICDGFHNTVAAYLFPSL